MVNRADRSHAYFVVNNTVPVGMVFYCDLPALNAYNICQIFIDKRYQGKGYGKQALSLILSMMTEDGKYNQVYVSYIRGNETARKPYESLGFVHTGFEFEGTIDMKRDLTQ